MAFILGQIIGMFLVSALFATIGFYLCKRSPRKNKELLTCYVVATVFAVVPLLGLINAFGYPDFPAIAGTAICVAGIYWEYIDTKRVLSTKAAAQKIVGNSDNSKSSK